MEKGNGFSFTRQYLRMMLWLRHRCDKLTTKQRKVIVYGLSLIYLICSIVMIAQFFLPQREKLPFSDGKLMDSPIRIDSISRNGDYMEYYTSINNNG